MYASTFFAASGALRLNRLLRLPLMSRVRRLLVATTTTCFRPSPTRLASWRAWTARLARLPLLRELHVHAFFVAGVGWDYGLERRMMLEALAEVGPRADAFLVTEYHALDVEVGEDLDVRKMPFVLRRGFFVK
jgi:hypothetical protein